MKLPEKIKNGLECCGTTIAEGRRTTCNAQCPYINEGIFCRNVLHGDTESYIVQLELYFSQISRALCGKESATICEVLDAVSQLKSRLAQVERERDAMHRDMKLYSRCKACKKFADGQDCPVHTECTYGGKALFEWRGVCAENTKEE